MQRRKKNVHPFIPTDDQLRTVMKALHPAREDKRSQLLEQKDKKVGDERRQPARCGKKTEQNIKVAQFSWRGKKKNFSRLRLSDYILVTKISLDRL